MTTNSTTPNEWRETIRYIYNNLHFGQDNVFTGNRLANRLIAIIEDRHPNYFKNTDTNQP